MKFIVTWTQMFLFAILVAITSAGLVLAVQHYEKLQTLPFVQMENGQCIKVINTENGDAYSCPDVNVVLRKYRTK